MIPELYGEYKPDLGVTGGSWQPTGKQEVVGLPINLGRVQGPETSWRFFYPGRFGAQLAPEPFRQELHAIDPRLEVVWHPFHERWQCWFQEPRVTFKLCPGWKPLFIVQYPDGSHMPLDARTLGEAWSRSPKVHGGKGREFFDRVVIESMRDRERAKTREHEGYVEAVARDRYRFAQIKNIGQGNKFTNHVAAD